MLKMSFFPTNFKLVPILSIRIGTSFSSMLKFLSTDFETVPMYYLVYAYEIKQVYNSNASCLFLRVDTLQNMVSCLLGRITFNKKTD